MFFRIYSYSAANYHPPVETISEDDIDWHLNQLQYNYTGPTFFENFIVFEADLTTDHLK